MLDWPEQTQTSPTRMFFTVMVFLPLNVISCVLLAAGASTWKIHLPWSSAWMVNAVCCQLRVTVISSFGSAQPQSETRVPAWRTMLSLMTAGKRTLADASAENKTITEQRVRATRRIGVPSSNPSQLGFQRRDTALVLFISWLLTSFWQTLAQNAPRPVTVPGSGTINHDAQCTPGA